MMIGSRPLVQSSVSTSIMCQRNGFSRASYLRNEQNLDFGIVTEIPFQILAIQHYCQELNKRRSNVQRTTATPTSEIITFKINKQNLHRVYNLLF
jgi:hypothetical protein